jgi:hypothetical protein
MFRLLDRAGLRCRSVMLVRRHEHIEQHAILGLAFHMCEKFAAIPSTEPRGAGANAILQPNPGGQDPVVGHRLLPPF